MAQPFSPLKPSSCPRMLQALARGLSRERLVVGLVNAQNVAPRIGEGEPAAARILVQLRLNRPSRGQDGRERRISIVCAAQREDGVAAHRGLLWLHSAELLTGPRRILDADV